MVDAGHLDPSTIKDPSGLGLSREMKAWIKYEIAREKEANERELTASRGSVTPVKSLPHVFHRVLGLRGPEIPCDPEYLYDRVTDLKDTFIESHELFADWLSNDLAASWDVSSAAPTAEECLSLIHI